MAPIFKLPMRVAIQRAWDNGQDIFEWEDANDQQVERDLFLEVAETMEQAFDKGAGGGVRMPRGMDERFEDPSDEVEEEDAVADEETMETSVESEAKDRETAAATEDRSDQQRTASTTDSDSSTSEARETDDEPLNIREDWDSATIYVEPEQSEDVEITFTRLKKQLKREDITLEKNKHFYRGVFEVAFGEHQEETKEKIRELARKTSISESLIHRFSNIMRMAGIERGAQNRPSPVLLNAKMNRHSRYYRVVGEKHSFGGCSFWVGSPSTRGAFRQSKVDFESSGRSPPEKG